MISFRKLAATAAFSALAFCGVASADPVTFGTYGNYTLGAGSPMDTTTPATTLLGDTSTLTGSGSPTPISLDFKGIATESVNSSPAGAAITLGTFTLNLPTSGSGAFTGTDKFVLHITQTVPGPTGNSDTTYDVSGNVTSTGTGDGATVKIDLSNSPDFFINGEEYILTNLVTLNQADNFTVALTGNVLGPAGAATPLPTSALSGMVLFGLIGLAKLRKVIFA